MLKILCVHGIGGHLEEDLLWRKNWKNALNNYISEYDVEFWCYDKIYEKYSVSMEEFKELVKELASKTNIYQFDFRSLTEDVWGMVVKWLAKKDLRKELQENLGKTLTNFSPHVIIGHSFGSVIAYQTLQNVDMNIYFISIGSQIANNVIKLYLGDTKIPNSVRRWYHLYNPYDLVFTEPININSNSFIQIETKFLNNFHDPFNYLNHIASRELWKYISINYDKFVIKEKFNKLWDKI